MHSVVAQVVCGHSRSMITAVTIYTMTPAILSHIQAVSNTLFLLLQIAGGRWWWSDHPPFHSQSGVSACLPCNIVYEILWTRCI